MQFISMDLIGSLDPSNSGYHYALIVICMLTRYTFCVSLKTKTASKVVQVYIAEIYAKFGGSVKVISYNGIEFKNELFTDVAT